MASSPTGSSSGHAFFAFNLQRLSGGAGTVGAEADIVPIDEVLNTYGVPGPTLGDVALVLDINHPLDVDPTGPNDQRQGTPKRSQSTETSEGLYAALGITEDPAASA